MTIKPLADRVLITPAPAEEVTIGGIIIPDSSFFGRCRQYQHSICQRFNVHCFVIFLFVTIFHHYATAVAHSYFYQIYAKVLSGVISDKMADLRGLPFCYFI